MTDELWEILEKMYQLSQRFIELTGLEDEDCNGDYITPKMPDVAEEIDKDILSDISCINGDLSYVLGKEE